MVEIIKAIIILMPEANCYKKFVGITIRHRNRKYNTP